MSFILPAYRPFGMMHGRFVESPQIIAGVPCAVGLFTFRSFLKIMANRVVSHAFEHPEFSAGRKSRFRARLGVVNFV